MFHIEDDRDDVGMGILWCSDGTYLHPLHNFRL